MRMAIADYKEELAATASKIAGAGKTESLIAQVVHVVAPNHSRVSKCNSLIDNGNA
jgi:hypothetical protein